MNSVESRTWAFLSVAILALISIQFPQSSIAAECGNDDEACWRTEWKKLCADEEALKQRGSVHDVYCHKLVNDDGSWIKPSWEVKESLKVLAPSIRDTGKKFGVDPRAIASAVFTENSINVTIRHNLENFLVKYKLGVSDGKIPILDRQFSFGWGQLYMDAARLAEPEVAKVEGRKVLRSADEIAQKLLVPEEAMKYIAGYLKIAQEKYAAAGYPIADKPEILATLYNLGKLDENLAATKRNGTTPKVNFFGFFVKHYQRDLDSLIKTTEPENTPPVQMVASTGTGPNGLKTKTVMAFKINVSLAQAAPHCPGNEGSGKDAEYAKVAAFRDSTVLKGVPSGTEYTVIAPDLGCNVNGDPEAWSLVRTSDGKTVGWIKNDELKKASAQVVRKINNCPTAPNSSDAQCLKDIQAIGKREFVGNDKKLGVVLKLSNQPGKTGKLSWQQGASYSCKNSSYKYINGMQSFNQPRGSSGQPSRKASQKEVESLIATLLEFRKRAQTELGLSDAEFASNSNPYLTFVGNSQSDFENRALSNLKSCLPQDGASEVKNVCFFDPSVEKNLTKLKIEKTPSYLEWKQFGEVVNFYYGTVPSDSTSLADSGKKEQGLVDKKNAILKKLSACRALTSELTESQAVLKKLFNAIEHLSLYPNFSNSISDSVLESINSDCNFVATGEYQTSGCSTCNPNATIYLNNNNISLSTDTLKTLVRTKKDKDAFLLERLNSSFPDYMFSSNSGQSNAESGCQPYDPLATAEQIKKILGLACVSTVYVPDFWLIEKLGRDPRVVLRPFLEDDRYSIEMKTAQCTE